MNKSALSQHSLKTAAILALLFLMGFASSGPQLWRELDQRLGSSQTAADMISYFFLTIMGWDSSARRYC